MSLGAMKQALEALQEAVFYLGSEYTCVEKECEDAITALRAAIEQAQPDELMIWKSRALHAERMIEKFMQPEQEPVAWMYVNTDGECEQIEYETPPDDPSITPLYPAPRQWQGLTDEEIENMMDYWSEPARSAYGGAHTANGEYVCIADIIRDAEAKLKEKNT